MARVSMASRDLLRGAKQIYGAALRAADPGRAVRRALQRGLPVAVERYRRVFLVAVGKAALPMACAVEEHFGERLTGGLVIAPHSAMAESVRLPMRTARHPIPDEAGCDAAEEVEALVRALTAEDLLLVAVSGGASALLPAPVAGLSLEDKQDVTARLLRGGADIGELNTVRKHLSRLKGGRLAALAQPATVVGLLLSDVIGNAPETIGSGLTAPDPATVADAALLLRRYGCERFTPRLSETPKQLEGVYNLIVGSNRHALAAAWRVARRLGYRAVVLTTSLAGEAREAGRVQASILQGPWRRPVCLLSGGETTVTVRGEGVGGRNQEWAIGAGLALRGTTGMLALSLGTDGVDGPTDAAGAWADGITCQDRGMAEDALRRNDSYRFLDKAGNLIRTGPTGTNVMDIQILLAR